MVIFKIKIICTYLYKMVEVITDTESAHCLVT